MNFNELQLKSLKINIGQESTAGVFGSFFQETNLHLNLITKSEDNIWQ